MNIRLIIALMLAICGMTRAKESSGEEWHKYIDLPPQIVVADAERFSVSNDSKQRQFAGMLLSKYPLFFSASEYGDLLERLLSDKCLGARDVAISAAFDLSNGGFPRGNRKDIKLLFHRILKHLHSLENYNIKNEDINILMKSLEENPILDKLK